MPEKGEENRKREKGNERERDVYSKSEKQGGRVRAKGGRGSVRGCVVAKVRRKGRGVRRERRTEGRETRMREGGRGERRARGRARARRVCRVGGGRYDCV